jgi:uncharacterized protein YecT (DUF1311 family)
MNSTCRSLCNFVLSLVACAPGVAWSQAPDPCKTQSNTLEINACAKQQFDAQDRTLNLAYQRLLAQLDNQVGAG